MPDKKDKKFKPKEGLERDKIPVGLRLRRDDADKLRDLLYNMPAKYVPGGEATLQGFLEHVIVDAIANLEREYHNVFGNKALTPRPEK